MGLIDKFKDLINVPDDDIYDDDFGFEENADQQDISSSRESTRSREYDRPREHSRERDYSREDSKRNKFVNIHATTQLQVVLVKPESFQDATSIADHLNQKRTVVVNLESTSKDVSRRLVDFLSGVAYANGGNMRKVAKNTFIVVARGVDVMGELLPEEFEDGKIYF